MSTQTTLTDTRTVRISEAKKLIVKAFNKKRPIFLWGPPGIGKSELVQGIGCLLYTSPSPRDLSTSRMPSSA